MEAEIEGLKVNVHGHVRRLLFSCYFSLLVKKIKNVLPSFCWEVFYLQFETIRDKIGEVLAKLIRGVAWSGRRDAGLLAEHQPGKAHVLPPGKHLSKIEQEPRH